MWRVTAVVCAVRQSAARVSRSGIPALVGLIFPSLLPLDMCVCFCCVAGARARYGGREDGGEAGGGRQQSRVPGEKVHFELNYCGNLVFLMFSLSPYFLFAPSLCEMSLILKRSWSYAYVDGAQS